MLSFVILPQTQYLKYPVRPMEQDTYLQQFRSLEVSHFPQELDVGLAEVSLTLTLQIRD